MPPCRFQFLGIPPKGELQRGTGYALCTTPSFQFLGIPPKGELWSREDQLAHLREVLFPISRDPPEGGTDDERTFDPQLLKFPISRDPPEGGTVNLFPKGENDAMFPISRDPPEGGTLFLLCSPGYGFCGFQFLGIPPKGEHRRILAP